MPIRPYKGFFISVEVIECPANELALIPVVRISLVEEGDGWTSLYSPVEFSTGNDAEFYGFRLGEKWIDERLAPSAFEKREVHKLTRYSLRLYECPNPECGKRGTYVPKEIDGDKQVIYRCFYCHKQVSEKSLEADL